MLFKWLVKKAIETREEMGDLNRLFSVSQFNKRNKLPDDEAFEALKHISVPTVQNVKVSYIAPDVDACHSDVSHDYMRRMIGLSHAPTIADFDAKRNICRSCSFCATITSR